MARLRAVGQRRGPGAARPAGRCSRRAATSSGSSASRACSTGSAARRTRCRRSSTSPAPTARARPAPSCAPRSKPRGTRVHVFTSPHLVRFNERIRLAGTLIDDEALAALLAEVLDVSADIEPSFFEVDHRGRLPRFRAHAGRRLHRRGRARRPARRDQRHRAAAGLRHRRARPRPSAIPRLRPDRHRRARKPAIAKRGRAAGRQQAYPRRDRSQAVGEVAAAHGAPLAPARRAAGTFEVDGRPAPLSRRARRARRCRCPRSPASTRRRMPRWRWRCCATRTRSTVPLAALAAACGWARWPARLQRLGPGPLTGARRRPIWLDGGHNPAAAQRVAALARGSSTARARCSSSACSPTRMRAASSSRSRRRAAALIAVPVPGHEHHAPDELARLARKLGFAAPPQPRPSAGGGCSPRRPAADPRLALPRRRSAAANGEVPD